MTHVREPLNGAKLFLQQMVDNKEDRDIFRHFLAACLQDLKRIQYYMIHETGNSTEYKTWFKEKCEHMPSYVRYILDLRDTSVHEMPVQPLMYASRTVIERLSLGQCVTLDDDGFVKYTDGASEKDIDIQWLGSECISEDNWRFKEYPNQNVDDICKLVIIELEQAVTEYENIFC